MPEGNPDGTLGMLHGDLTAGFGEMRAGFADLKAEMRAGFADMKAEMRAGFTDMKVTLVTGFAGLASRESSEEMILLLREGNRLQEMRFTQLDVRIHEQHVATQHVLHALTESHALLAAKTVGLSTDITRLIARIDALIRGRRNGEPPV